MLMDYDPQMYASQLSTYIISIKVSSCQLLLCLFFLCFLFFFQRGYRTVEDVVVLAEVSDDGLPDQRGRWVV
jgi:hypothetical protein